MFGKKGEISQKKDGWRRWGGKSQKKREKREEKAGREKATQGREEGEKEGNQAAATGQRIQHRPKDEVDIAPHTRQQIMCSFGKGKSWGEKGNARRRRNRKRLLRRAAS